MAEVLAMDIGSWLTTKLIDSLAEHFLDETGEAVFGWSKSLRKLITSSIEYRAITGMHEDLREGMTAFTASISAVHASQVEGTEAVKRQLVALGKSQHHDQQLTYLKTAVDALEDVCCERYTKGNPKNVGLLETASKNAELAARAPYGSLETRLKAYRIWVGTSYMHEVMTRTPKDAKEEAMYIVGRVISSDADLIRICSSFAESDDLTDEPFRAESDIDVTTAKIPWAGELGTARELSSVDAPTVMEFFLELMSSVIMLPPLDQDVSCKQIMEVIGAGVKMGDNGQMELVGGEVVLGRDASEVVMQAMGKYCASRHDTVQMYPTVSALALSRWEKNKERLALDNFFRSTGGENWIFNHGWMDRTGELRHRYGVAVEDGHVTKICLSTNNLKGGIQQDLADCDHLRELILHGNDISGGDVPAYTWSTLREIFLGSVIPKRLRRFVDNNPKIIVTGLPLLRGTEDKEAKESSPIARRGIDMSESRSISENKYISGANSIKRNKKRRSFMKRTRSLFKETTK